MRFLGSHDAISVVCYKLLHAIFGFTRCDISCMLQVAACDFWVHTMRYQLYATSCCMRFLGSHDAISVVCYKLSPQIKSRQQVEEKENEHVTIGSKVDWVLSRPWSIE